MQLLAYLIQILSKKTEIYNNAAKSIKHFKEIGLLYPSLELMQTTPLHSRSGNRAESFHLIYCP